MIVLESEKYDILRPLMDDTESARCEHVYGRLSSGLWTSFKSKLIKNQKISIYHPEDINTSFVTMQNAWVKSWQNPLLSGDFQEIISPWSPFLCLFPIFEILTKIKTFYISTIYTGVQKAACGALSPTF